MAQRALTDSFALHSDLSRRLPWQVSRDEQADEVQAELADRRATYPRLIQRERMSREEADRHLAIWQAITDDHIRDRAWRKIVGTPGAFYPPTPAHSFAIDWETRVRELRRELALRRNLYAKRIASPTSQLTADVARRKLEALDAVHYRYWCDLFGFCDGAQDATQDLARHAHVIAAAVEHATPDWERLTQDDGHAAHVGDYARSQMNAWQIARRIVDQVRQGGSATTLVTRAQLGRLSLLIDAALERAIDTALADRRYEWRVAQLLPLARWLERLAYAEAAIWPAPIHQPRIAA